MRSDFTQHSTVQSGRTDQKFLTNPEKTRVVFTSLAKKILAGIVRGNVLHTKRDEQKICFKLRRTSHQRCTWKGSNHRHVCGNVHIPMCRRIDQTRGTRRTSSATPFDHFSQRLHETSQQCGRRLCRRKILPATRQAAEREAAEDKDDVGSTMSFTVTTLHLAVSHARPAHHRSRHL